MNFRLIFNIIGKVLVVEAILLLFPFIAALCYLENNALLGLGVTAAVAAVAGVLLIFLVKPKKASLFAKEGLVITAFAWVIMSLIGALPFVISGEIPSYIDALFEIVSGFTTTGASALTGEMIEGMSKGLLFWRSFSHWIGGMGVLVFVLLVSNRNDRAMHILRAEMPGPTVDKLVPKARNTAFILYAIYIALTVLLTILLWCGEMTFYESLIHAFGTAGAGGFSTKANSLGAYGTYSQWVIGIFMFIFAINFNLFYLLIVGKVSSFFKSRELWIYVIIVIASVTLITINIYDTYNSVSAALTHSTFQVASIISTTGYSTADFNNWPALSKAILFILMFVGGCAGSTAGGFKLTRVIILIKKVGNDLRHVLHPRTTTVVKINGKKVSDETINGVMSYLAIYLVIFFAVFFLISFDPGVPSASAFETNFTAVTACFNNIGPGFAGVGPAESYAFYSPFSKLILTITMLLGRLEIYPILLTFSVGAWLKK